MEVSRIIGDPCSGEARKDAARAAIDGTPEELRHFLEVRRYQVDA